MKRFQFVLLASALGIAANAQPVISSNGVNAASYANPMLPNSGIAQGSIFSIFGSGLGPAKAVSASSFPLPSNLGGSSVSVTVDGTTENAILFYAAAGQINALLPSTTPVGQGTLTVTYNNQTSAATGIQVVANTFGIFTSASSGTGPGILTDGAGRPNSYTVAASPGQILNLWGTGLGPIAGPDNELPPTGNIGKAPVVYVGGVQVTPGYYGRSGCCSGVDQIQVQIPQSVSGCSVPVAVQTSGGISNFVSISVASGSSICSDAMSGLDGSAYQQLFAKNGGSIGVVTLGRMKLSSELLGRLFGIPSFTADSGTGNFRKYTFASSSIFGLPFVANSYGACSVFAASEAVSTANPTSSGLPSGLSGPYSTAALDAGNVLTVSGPNGSKSIQLLSPGQYQSELGTDTTLPGDNFGPLYFSQGTYTVSSLGGVSVGAFHLSLQVPPPLVWANQSSFNSLPRSEPVTIEWTGGDPDGYVNILGASLSGGDPSNLSGVEFLCTAKTSDQKFTIPALVLQALPASPGINVQGVTVPTGLLGIVGSSKPVPFTTTGLNLGLGMASYAAIQSMTFR